VKLHTGVTFAILGPLEVRRDGRAVEVAGQRLRALLALLLLAPGRTVPTETLISGVWEDRPPSGVGNALQALVSRLRAALDADRGLLVADPHGYRLSVRPRDVDAHEFARLAADGRAALDGGDAARAAETLRAALRLWRGPALPELSNSTAATAEIARLEQLRLAAIEDRIEADLRLGAYDGLPAEIARLIAAHPLRERLRGQLMRALYESGRQVEALAAYEEAKADFAERLGADPSPELAALHLSMLRREHTPRAAAPVRPPPAAAAPAETIAMTPPADRAGNLRARLTSFVGREQEVERVGRLLAERRLVTLVGPGGAGKTRLAVESADAIGGRMPDGVWLVELAPLRDEVEIPQAVLTALGLRDLGSVPSSPRPAPPRPPEGGDPAGRLAALLASRTMLLILDNCEHLVDAAARLADRLLAECPGVRVLATSREPLGITGETLLTVPPLALPPPDDPDARGYPAVRLFLDRAAGVRPGHRIEDLSAVARICRALDGLPLAIELAAARLRSLSAEQIADRLGDRFRLLTGGSRTAMPRHQTLRAVVEWSWELLDERELRLARRLAVFTGGATLEAVERVCAGEGLPEHDVLDVLARLVDKSLVVMEERDGVPRYRMLETIRAYAAERLAEAGEEERCRLAHARHFRDLVETAEPHLRRHEQVEWLERLTGEHDDVTAALSWAVRTGRAGLAAEFAGGLTWYWWLVGRRAEGARWAGEVLRLAREGGETLDPRDVALLHVGFAINGQGAGLVSDEEARAALRKAARLGREHGHRNPLAVLAEPMLAVMMWDDRSEEPLTDLAGHDDPWVRALARMFRSYLWLNFGRLADAEPEAEQVVRLFRETGDRWGIGMGLSALAEIHLLRGNIRRAVAVLEETLALTATMRTQEDLPHIRCRLAIAVYALGDRDGAFAHLDEAERLYAELRDDVGLAFVQHVRAEMARWEGDIEAARAGYAKASAILGRARIRAPQQGSLMRLGLVYLAIEDGDLVRAERLLGEALDFACESMDGPVIAANAVCHAALALAKGETERAAVLLGIGHGLRGSHDPVNRDCVRVVDQAKAALGPRFEANYEQGRAMSRDQALTMLRP
jgi:predicted ATPase/DNA-binding SARP family transcriptional activator